MNLEREDFGEDFLWGVTTSAYQNEGAFNVDGKGPSIWDDFTKRKSKIKDKKNGNVACDFYHFYKEDIRRIKDTGLTVFRFSLSWARIMPDGKKVNQQGVDFYNKVIDECLHQGITPFVTLYHWDLPLALQKEGGWRNRNIIEYFLNYTQVAIHAFGDRVKDWIILNEGIVFTGAGYFLGIHAPGKRGIKSFLAAVHHALIAQSQSLKLIKSLNAQLRVGTALSMTKVSPYSNRKVDRKAANRVNALLNRLFIEPHLGLGYPVDELAFFNRMQGVFLPGDEELLPANFDFWGIQSYTREVIKRNRFVPYIFASPVSPKKRGVPYSAMGMEIYPSSLKEMIRLVSKYDFAKPIIITECGQSYLEDHVEEDEIVNDTYRIDYYKSVLGDIKKLKKEGHPIKGFFIWTLTDNFEWSEGYIPRFGIYHTNFNTMKRTPKASQKWIKKLLKK